MINLFVQVCLPKITKELYFKVLPSVINLLVQVCLPMSVDQNGMIHLVPAKCDHITCTSMSAKEHWLDKSDTLSSCKV